MELTSTMLSRRGVLAGLGTAAALTAAGPGVAASGPGAIDVHGHFIPRFYRRALRRHGVRRLSGLPIPDWSPELALRFQDRHGIAAQILSLPDPATSFVEEYDERLRLTRRVNDYLAELVQSKRRFGGLATLPLRDLSVKEQLAAADEARRAVRGLGLDGVSILSNYGDTYLGHPTLAPLMLALNGLRATVVVHPNAWGVRPPTGLPPALLEAPFNTTRAMVQMSYLQAFTLYPNIRWVFSDAGGTLPYLSYRTSLLQVYPAIAQNLGIDLLDLDERNLDYGRQGYDTAWAASPAALASTAEVAGPTRMLFGTDWPLSAPTLPSRGDAQPTLADAFTGRALTGVERGNALRLFPTFAARLA